jgi:hypothetical protein
MMESRLISAMSNPKMQTGQELKLDNQVRNSNGRESRSDGNPSRQLFQPTEERKIA